MIIQLKPAVLCNLFDDFVGNTPTMFNFSTDGKVLDIQMLGDYTATLSVPVESIDGDYSPKSASFWVYKYIHVMNRDEYIRITLTDAAVFIQQNTFYCTLLCEYEERRVLPDISSIQFSPAFAGRLKYLAHLFISCAPMAKELSIPDPDPVFCRGKFYLSYRQAAIVESISYPETCVPAPMFRAFAFKLDEKTEYAYLQDKNTFVFKTSRYVFWVPTVNYEISNSTLNTFDKKILECREVTEVVFSGYAERLNMIVSAFPKQQLQFVVGDKSYSFIANTNKSHIQVGYEVQSPIFSMNITSAQLGCIVKVFGEDESVKILRGVGCICLRSGTRNMLIAGRSY